MISRALFLYSVVFGFAVDFDVNKNFEKTTTVQRQGINTKRTLCFACRTLFFNYIVFRNVEA